MSTIDAIRAIYRYPMKDRSAEALAVAALAPSETLAGDRRYAIGDTISPAAGGG